MADDVRGILIASQIIPSTDGTILDHATHLARFGNGGWQEVSTIADRNAITDDRLELGMAVYVTSEAKLYILSGLDKTSKPYTTTWTEFKSGSSDAVIRKTASFVGFNPLFNGEIIQYIGDEESGESGDEYVHGYFYKATEKRETLVSFIPDDGTNTVVSIDPEDFKNFIAEKCEFVEEDPRNITRGHIEMGTGDRYGFTMYAGDRVVRSVSFPIQEFLDAGFTFTPPLGSQEGVSFVCLIDRVAGYDYLQINVQPEQILEWGNIGGTLTNQTDLKEALDSKVTQVSNLNVGAYPRIQNAIVQYIGENTTDDVSGEPYINGYFYKCVLEPFAEGIGWLIWRKVAVQDGNVNDVQIYGNSVVTNHIADLSVVEQLTETTMPYPTVEQLGRIVQYTGANGLVSGYIRGYFYECKSVTEPSSVSIETDTQEGSTMSDVGCQKEFIEYNFHPTTNMNWEFIYNGEENRWTLDDEVVDILDWGLYFNGTAVNGDTIYLDYEVARTDYRWVAIDTQEIPEIETITNAEIDEMWS